MLKSTPSKSRSSEGCWTCRLRRKKCDEARPVCQACAALEIHCHYSDAKPDWMDNGPKQKEMAFRLKAEVKKQANCRREKRFRSSLDGGSHEQDRPFGEGSEDEFEESPGFLGTETPASSENSATSHGAASANGDSTFRMDTVMTVISDITPASSIAAADATPESTTEPAAHGDAWQVISPEAEGAESMPEGDKDLNAIMTYLDYVFPFLFPFYRPPLLEGGRGWLLCLLHKNKALFHTALSLSSYFFSTVLNTASTDDHTPCKVAISSQLQTQQELALKELQQAMCSVNARGVQGYLRESAQVMESILQLLAFDVAIANVEHWQMHLDAATTLLEQILPGPESWDQVLTQLGGPYFPLHVTPNKAPWMPEQAAFRFFAADLIFIDTVSSTALGRPPRLQRYHPAILAPPSHVNPDDAKPLLNLQDFLGIENWVVYAVGEVAALDTWKKEQKRAGSLSVSALVSRATSLEDMIRAGLSCLDQRHAFPGTPPDPALAIDTNMLHQQHVSLTPEPLLMDQPITAADGAFHTRIWAYACLTYLSVVVSGWQPASSEIASSVAITTSLLLQLHNPACLTQLVWPFCVTGCLVGPELEQLFRDMVDRVGSLKAFGSTRHALAVMERVWAMRDMLDSSWDLTAAFNGLGHAALLI